MCKVFGVSAAGRLLSGWLVGGNVFVRLAAGSRWFDFLVNCLLMFSLAAHGVVALVGVVVFVGVCCVRTQ